MTGSVITASGEGAWGPILWAVCARPLVAGEFGDVAVVEDGPDSVLLAVIDGLGHGPDAAHAARAAAAALRTRAQSDPALLLTQCHAALRHTRGAAITLARIYPERRRLAWAGVGSVQAGLWKAKLDEPRPSQRLVVAAGVLGHEMPTVRAATVRITPGDTLVLATDGVTRRFADTLVPTQPPASLAERVMNEYATHKDDAVVLAVRFQPDHT